ncbi:MAG: saccharopine dehydrogenase NADP-binding domain-containing protein [Planctomycetota bacterium]|nr:saccharopine dehydrogenase NADP-binding domain-containing protein [Planctomycetota bacterium]MDP6942256.1 saccharopine dehydrogenase NADP-binding domain-containing protein [Planctomycetota bacterium]
MVEDRKFDLVLQGATGFTGKIAARELVKHAPSNLRWAVAGRRSDAVQKLADELGVGALVADGLDPNAVQALAKQTRVVLSCAGPFSRYGTPLVEACAQNQTHYADLTGELPWIHSLIQKHHHQCEESGTAIVPASGFDSAPTDLCVQEFCSMLQEQQLPLSLYGFFSLRGGFNGGTLHSGYAMAEDGHAIGMPTMQIGEVPALKKWFAPFLMAPVNESIVTRSAKLQSKNIQYQEFMLCKNKFEAKTIRTALKLITSMFASPTGRRIMKWVGPKPGEGPSERRIQNGFANLTLIAGSLEKPSATQTWKWAGDPSNLITVRCLVQTGLALAAGEHQGGGVLTPATALGPALLNRLKQTQSVKQSEFMVT